MLRCLWKTLEIILPGISRFCYYYDLSELSGLGFLLTYILRRFRLVYGTCDSWRAGLLFMILLTSVSLIQHTFHHLVAAKYLQRHKIIVFVYGILSLVVLIPQVEKLCTAMISIDIWRLFELNGTQRYYGYCIRGFLCMHYESTIQEDSCSFDLWKKKKNLFVQDPSESLVVVGRYISENYNGAALHPIDFVDISTGKLVAEVMDPNITTISPVNKLHPRYDILASGSSRCDFYALTLEFMHVLLSVWCCLFNWWSKTHSNIIPLLGPFSFGNQGRSLTLSNPERKGKSLSVGMLRKKLGGNLEVIVIVIQMMTLPSGKTSSPRNLIWSLLCWALKGNANLINPNCRRGSDW